MLLTLDIGNTNITFGVFDETGGAPDYAARATWRIATDRDRLADEYGLLLSNLLSVKGISTGMVDAATLCSVVPPLTPVFVELCRDYFGVEPMVVGAGVKTGIKVM